MKLPFKIIALLILSTVFSFAAPPQGTLIPKDSTSEWDYRGEIPVHMTLYPTAKLLPQCKTYEELRDTLLKLIPELRASPSF